MEEKPPEGRPLQFGMRTLLEIIAVAAFVFALLYYRTGKSNVGRYQGFASDGWKFILDTETGIMWRSPAHSDDPWAPVQKLPAK